MTLTLPTPIISFDGIASNTFLNTGDMNAAYDFARQNLTATFHGIPASTTDQEWKVEFVLSGNKNNLGGTL
jgi:hypothetical protein